MFTEIFVDLLQKNDVTAYQVAKNTGISQGLMGEYKKGIKLPTIQNLIKIADYFNISIDYLLGRTEQQFAIVQVNDGDLQGKKLFDNYEKMNETAQRSLVDYSDYMASKPENLKSTTDTSQMTS